ncbi:MAG: hypothetical protein AAF092_18115 [Pseudomonadota bacterium]
MHVLADTQALVAHGVISPHQAREIEQRGRAKMVSLAANAILIAGIMAATGGLIFWLADARAVALLGLAALGMGTLVGRRFPSMISGAATLIGAGLLIGGGALELVTSHDAIAGPVLATVGAGIAAAAAWRAKPPSFVTRAIGLMGLAAHLLGAGHIIDAAALSGLPLSAFWLYATALLVAAGWWLDVRLVTALAIVPFAQALETGTFYWHATYAFYSPESTLSILQMSAAIALCLALVKGRTPRHARHADIFALMAFVVANLCALVGSLWGDVVGEHIWGVGRYRDGDFDSYDTWSAAHAAFRDTALTLSPGLYAVVWAIALAAIASWAAWTARRGLFNATVTFAAIHGYTQLFESFGTQPWAYAVGGLTAIPLAWSLWRANDRIAARRNTATPPAAAP